MNINADKEIGITEKKFIFGDEKSPYLSPFHGLSEPSQQFYSDYISELEIDPSEPRQDQSKLFGSEYPHQINFDHFKVQEFRDQVSVNQLKKQKKMKKSIMVQVKQQQIKQLNDTFSLEPMNIVSLLNFLVLNDNLTEVQSLSYCQYFSKESQQHKTVFQILADKFKKLKKTKEEMTKYCMRKSFKFITDFKSSLKKKGVPKSETEIIISKINYQTPFKQHNLLILYRKNSQEKTMNSQFLKQTFSQEEFVTGYQQFLKQINELIHQDNQIKIDAFAKAIQKAILGKQMDRIRQWNRLPWTKKILDKTQKLAHNLLEYAQAGENQKGESDHNSQGI